MQANSDDQRLTGYILWNPALIANRQWRISGRDLFTGVESTVLESTVLGGDVTAALRGDRTALRDDRLGDYGVPVIPLPGGAVFLRACPRSPGWINIHPYYTG